LIAVLHEEHLPGVCPRKGGDDGNNIIMSCELEKKVDVSFSSRKESV
jgi:hypothetical protein